VIADPHLDWLINDFVRATPDVGSAMVVSGDGLVLAASTVIDETLADRLAAVTSGLVSLASGAAEMLDADPVRQTIVEMGGGYLFINSISAGSALAVFASGRCDMGLVGYEMTMLAARVGHALTPDPRPAAEQQPVPNGKV
jgi:predicted regulator of Ras-like GTPase activity (Roadblock/LC7/MglB family)